MLVVRYCAWAYSLPSYTKLYYLNTLTIIVLRAGHTVIVLRYSIVVRYHPWTITFIFYKSARENQKKLGEIRGNFQHYYTVRYEVGYCNFILSFCKI